MAYEHTVTNPFTMPGGRAYAIGDKIADEAEAEAICAKHLGRNLSRHEVTTAEPEPEKSAEAAPDAKASKPSIDPALSPTAAPKAP